MSDHATILLVDDVPESLSALAEILGAAGFVVLPADSGELALASVAARPPDLVLLDIRMPGMDGFEVCRRLKSDAATAEIPVIFLSAGTDLSDRVGAFEVGAVDYVSKPVQPIECLARVRTHIALSQTTKLLRQRALELERAQAETSASEERYRTTLVGIGDAVISTDADGRIDLINPVAEAMTGWSVDEARGRPLQDVFRVVNEVTRVPVVDPVTIVLRENAVVGLANHSVLIARDGTERPIADSGAPTHGSDGQITGVVLVFRDQSVERTASEALYRSNAHLHRAQSIGSVGSWTWHTEADRLEWSDQMYRLFGIDREGFDGNLATVIAQAIHPDDRAIVEEANRSVVDAAVPRACEYRIVLPDGTVRTVWAEAEALELDAAGKPVRLTGIVQDITARKLADAALAARSQQQSALADISRAALLCADIQGVLDMAVTRVASVLGVEMAKVLEMQADGAALLLRAGVGWHDGLVGSVAIGVGEESQAAFTLAGCEPVVVTDLATETRFRGPDLLLDHHVVSGVSVVVGSDDTPYGVLGAHTTQRRAFTSDDVGFVQTVANILGEAFSSARARAALAQTAIEWQQTFDATSSAIWILDQDQRIIRSNRAAEAYFGQPCERMLGLHCWEIAHGTTAPVCECPALRAFRTMQRESIEMPIGDRWVDVTVDPFQNADGLCAGAVHTVRDITERKEADAERERLLGQLAQAQRTEAVGRLAGGVAHDFNNMLMAVLNYTELARDCVEPDHPVMECLDEIESVSQRSANLTRQLLAFARRQTIAPTVLDLNTEIGSMLKMLRRLIGEHIDLVWKPAQDLWPVKADPSQIDQVLANLSVNARDAMPGTGTLTVETANITADAACSLLTSDALPGDYVMVSVNDTGHGIDADTMQHIFEPFYTTKAFGEGTGLGLATVFGIIQQNAGFVNVTSEPGRGTAFRIYLPKSAAIPPAVAPAPGATQQPGSGETILLVEDERAIRVSTERLLERLGYRVLAAGAPAEALLLAQEWHQTIDLLLTDVVMPEMSGRELATRLLELRPGLRCLYMSGYTASVIAQHGVLDEGVRFLSKPFTRDALARGVRAALDDTPPV
ncbi:MAG: response regulator [Armatimonadetes bacterium]|nr:response regulator [Armatimonadota bacterium]